MKGQGRCVPMVLALLWLGAQIAWPQPPADFTQGVSLTLGATNQENGIRLLPPRRETQVRVANMIGRECRATDKANGQYWMEFVVDQAYIQKTVEMGQSLEVTYFDNGKGSVALMYRAAVREVEAQHHLRIAQRTGTDTWKTVRVSLPDAHIAGRGTTWHLRLSGESWANEDLYISEVRLDRKGVWLKATPDALATKPSEPCEVRALVTDEAGHPLKEPITVKFLVSAGTIESEKVTQGGVVQVRFVPPAIPGDVTVSAECPVGQSRITLPVVSGSGKVVSRKRVLGFEPGDLLDAARSLKTFCERFDLITEEANRYEGQGAAKMDYSFEDGKWGLASIYMGKQLPGRPTSISVQVYSDGPACELNFLMKDSQDQEAQRHGCTLWGKGFSSAVNLMDSPQIPWMQGFTQPVQYPLTLEHVALRAMPIYGKRFNRTGTVYFDFLVVEFLAAESEVAPVPIEASSKQQGDRLLVALKNTAEKLCHARASCWLVNPVGVWIGPLPITKPFELKPGEVVEFPLSFPEIPEDPQKMKPGEYAVEIAAVVVETGDLVEIQSRWRKQ